MLVYVRPSNEALLRARVPGAQDQCGCPSNPFIVGALRAYETVLPLSPFPITPVTLLLFPPPLFRQAQLFPNVVNRSATFTLIVLP